MSPERDEQSRRRAQRTLVAVTLVAVALVAVAGVAVAGGLRGRGRVVATGEEAATEEAKGKKRKRNLAKC